MTSRELTVDPLHRSSAEPRDFGPTPAEIVEATAAARQFYMTTLLGFFSAFDSDENLERGRRSGADHSDAE
ncbi:MAG: hypothetical protein ABIZ04_25020 [Opitutus sp.]